jgi:hypothetical protein
LDTNAAINQCSVAIWPKRELVQELAVNATGDKCKPIWRGEFGDHHLRVEGQTSCLAYRMEFASHNHGAWRIRLNA